jgi:hypothetical protein
MRFADAYRERTPIVIDPYFAKSIEIGFLVHLKYASSRLGSNQRRGEAGRQRARQQ